MKFLISVDLEGVACACGVFSATVDEAFNIASIRKQASLEADAAVRALFDNGAEEVVVWDSHGGGCSLDYSLIDERAQFAIGGTVGTRFPIIEGIDGLLLIGYHSMAGTMDGALAHSFSSKTYQYMKINGQMVGEIAVDAMVAGDYGVPVIFVSSDDKGVAEAKEVLPWVSTCQTKKSLANTRIISKHPAAAVKDIYQGVCEAVSRMPEMQIYRAETPIELEVRFCRADVCRHANLRDHQGKPFAFRDAYTRYGKLDRCEDAIFYL